MWDFEQNNLGFPYHLPDLHSFYTKRHKSMVSSDEFLDFYGGGI
jgi:hypothetical protein